MKRIATILTISGLFLSAAPAALAHGGSAHHKHHGRARCAAAHRRHHHKKQGCRAHASRVFAHIAVGHHHRPRHVARQASVLPALPSLTTGNPGVRCDMYAAPAGSDTTGDGSLGRPFGSVSKLDAALHPGQTGCLRAGRYGGLQAWHRIDTNGTPSGRITLTSAPGETATIVGWVDVEAAYTTISRVRIDGSNTLYDTKVPGVNCPLNVSKPLVIAGHDDILEYDNYYQSVARLRGVGIGIGFWGDADNTIVRYSKIHDIAGCQAYDHLIYLSHGNNVRIYDNWMWNDPNGRGIQLYPDPTNARIWGNVIDHVGVGFNIGDEAGDDPAGNQIYDNVVINSVGLPWQGLRGQAINIYWGGRPAQGNSFTNNLSFNNPGGIGALPNVAGTGNVTADPQLANPSAHDYRVRPGSPVARWPMWDGR